MINGLITIHKAIPSSGLVWRFFWKCLIPCTLHCLYDYMIFIHCASILFFIFLFIFFQLTWASRIFFKKKWFTWLFYTFIIYWWSKNSTWIFRLAGQKIWSLQVLCPKIKMTFLQERATCCKVLLSIIS